MEMALVILKVSSNLDFVSASWTGALSSELLYAHAFRQSNRKVVWESTGISGKRNCKRKVFTLKMLSSLQKKSEYQSDNARVPFSCFQMKPLCGCWTLQEPLFLLTATLLQIQHNGRAEAQQLTLYWLGCVAIIVCSHILLTNEEKIYSAQKMQFLAICFSSAFGWWHGTAMKYSIELFWRYPVCL